jgi:hypothetical protein
MPKNAQLAFYAQFDRKPVQASENRSDAMSCPSSDKKSGRYILYMMKCIECCLRKSCED